MIADHDVAHGSTGTEEEGENYFISMTDMMVGILFVFIIMLMVFALNLQRLTDQTRDQINVADDLARQIADLQERIDSEFTVLNEADAARRRLLTSLKERLQSAGLAVEIDEANGVLRLAEDAIRFAPNDSRLSEQASSNVQKVAGVLGETLPAFTLCSGASGCPQSGEANRVETVFIEGHTDVTGSDDRNWQLSTERAVNTYRRIIEAAPALRNLRNGEAREVLSVSGYASTRPVAEGTALVDYDRNRRIDLRFVMEANDRKRLSEISRLLGEMNAKIRRLREPPPADGKGLGLRTDQDG
ncbi:flagellar motor protein MotB [Aurantimonas coralicida]|uniref:OmpA/MotB family protein n=1 Tax=Aurantimonas coralicida TaxID=182270 RepID=UPI001E2A3A30|nr:OmpA family protein [Aurantimonas coralicida]MCD1645309.1 OmpA family protein [Aurantimonas coralicida]